jgi:hypothetical protein
MKNTADVTGKLIAVFIAYYFESHCLIKGAIYFVLDTRRDRIMYNPLIM